MNLERSAMQELVRKAAAQMAMRLPANKALMFRRLADIHFLALEDQVLEEVSDLPDPLLQSVLLGLVLNSLVPALFAQERRSPETRLYHQFWTVFGTDLHGQPLVPGTDLANLDGGEAVVDLLRGLDALRQSHQDAWRVLNLRFYQGMKRCEICEIMGKSTGKVRHLEDVGIDFLRKSMKGARV